MKAKTKVKAGDGDANRTGQTTPTISNNTGLDQETVHRIRVG